MFRLSLFSKNKNNFKTVNTYTIYVTVLFECVYMPMKCTVMFN